MKNVLAIAALCLLSLSLTAGRQTTKASNVEDHIKKQEQNWAEAVVKEGAASVDEYEADDIITTDPTGRATDKAQDRTDLSSDDYKIQSEQLSDLQVHVYGNVAVAAATKSHEGYLQGARFKRQVSLHGHMGQAERQVGSGGVAVHKNARGLARELNTKSLV